MNRDFLFHVTPNLEHTINYEGFEKMKSVFGKFVGRDKNHDP